MLDQVCLLQDVASFACASKLFNATVKASGHAAPQGRALEDEHRNDKASAAGLDVARLNLDQKSVGAAA